jgi:hypothetical protein
MQTDAYTKSYPQSRPDLSGAKIKFAFVPEELISKCTALVQSYHAINGYPCLPDMLWRSHAREVIEKDKELARIFKKCCKIRGAKNTERLLLFLTSLIVALEILIRDFAGWGSLFPDAKQKAEKLMRASWSKPLPWLMTSYVYSTTAIKPDLHIESIE